MKASWLACMVLLLGSMLVPGSSGQAGFDLAIEEVRVTPAPAWHDGIPTTPTVEVLVRNWGTLPSPSYRVTLHWRVGGSQQYINGEEAKSFDVYQSLEAGGSRQRSIRWTLQSNQVGDGKIHATIDPASGDTAPGNNAFTTATIPIGLHALELSVPDATESLSTNELETFRVAIANNGNTAETLRLSASATDPTAASRLWMGFDPGQITVPPNSVASADLYVSRPFDGNLDPFETRVDVAVDSAWRTLTGRTGTIRNTESGYGNDYAFSARGPAETSFVPRGQAATIHANIINHGSRNDTYVVTAQALSGWTAQLGLPEALGQQRLRLEPMASASIPLQIAAPQGAVPGLAGNVTLTVQSDHEGSSELAIPVMTDGPALRLVSIGPDGTFYEATPTGFTARVRNVGNQPSLPTTARLELRQALIREWTAEAEAIAPGAFVDYAFKPRWDGSGPVDWTFALQQPAAPIVAQGRLDVRKPDIAITVPIPGATSPGQLVTYHAAPNALRIENRGAWAENLTVTITTDLGLIQPAGPTTVELPSGAVRTVPFSHQMPVTYGNKTNATIKMHVAIVGQPGFAWNSTVRSPVKDTVPPRIVLMNPSGPVWAVGVPLALRWSINDSGSVRLASAALRLPTLLDLTGAVRSGDSWEIPVGALNPGNYSLALVATDPFGNRQNATFNWTVKPVSPPEIRPARTASTVAHGLGWNFSVKDPFGIDTILVRGRGPAGPVELGLAVAGDDYTILRNATTPGLYELVVVAVNKAGSSSEFAFNVTLLPPPTTDADGEPTGPGQGAPGFGIGVAILALIALAWRGRRS